MRKTFRLGLAADLGVLALVALPTLSQPDEIAALLYVLDPTR